MNPPPLTLITGAATDGIGSAITRRLHAEGFEVLGTYEHADVERARALESELDRLTLLEVDHADRASLTRFLDHVPRDVDALVSAQFLFELEDPMSFDFAQWDRSIAVNLTAPVFLFHGLGDRLAESARVVTVTSTEGFVGSFGAAAYAASKAAIHNVTMSLANVAGARGQRVNAVAAGWIGGVMDTDEVFNMSRAITPLGRLGAPEEIADVVAYLVSSASSFVNGTVVTADGGYRGVDTIAKYEFEAGATTAA